MKLTLITIVLVAVAAMGIAATTASSDPTPAQQIAKLKQQLRASKSTTSDLQDQVDTLNGITSDQADTIQRLQNRLANQPDPLDAITARGPDGLWAAMRAIWLAFPTQDPSQICGYDRSNVPGDSDGLTVTSYTFYRWTGC